MSSTPNKPPLFTLPIPPCDKTHPGGAVTVTEPLPQVYLLTIASPPDNRQTTALCQTLLRALDLVEFSGLPSGVVVTTSALPKFFSNGLDLEHAIRIGDEFWIESLWKVYRRFLTFPMPTVAWINGHAFAGGLMLAMHHDYRVMNPSRGFVCLNELEFGAPLKPPMSSIFRCKVPSPHVYRSLVLEAHRFGGTAAAEAGIVDVAGGWDEVVALIRERKLTDKGRTGVYGLLKMEMYRECLDLLENHPREERKDQGWVDGEAARKEKGKAWVAKYLAENQEAKAKL